jgi:dihydrodipicolinate synthase/N-acetylneuraminate lyase
MEAPPSAEAMEAVSSDPRIKAIKESENPKEELHRIVQTELAKLDVLTAAALAWWGESAF